MSRPFSRRALLRTSANGFGLLALAGLLKADEKANPDRKGEGEEKVDF